MLSGVQMLNNKQNYEHVNVVMRNLLHQVNFLSHDVFVSLGCSVRAEHCELHGQHPRCRRFFTDAEFYHVESAFVSHIQISCL